MSNRIYTAPMNITYPTMGDPFASAEYDEYYQNAISQHQIGYTALRLNGFMTGSSSRPIIGDCRTGGQSVANTESQTMTLPVVVPSGADLFTLVMRYKMAKTGSQVQEMTIDLKKWSNTIGQIITQNLYTTPASGYNVVQDIYSTGGALSNVNPNDIRNIGGFVEKATIEITVTKSPTSPATSNRPLRYWDGLMSLCLIFHRQ